MVARCPAPVPGHTARRAAEGMDHMMEGMPRRLVLGTAVALPLVALAERVGSGVEHGPHRAPASPATSTTTSAMHAPAGPSPTGVPGNWRIVLDDDFEGTSLDTSLWNTQYPWGEDNNGDGSENCYLPSNVALDGQGNLVLTRPAGRGAGHRIERRAQVLALQLGPGEHLREVLHHPRRARGPGPGPGRPRDVARLLVPAGERLLAARGRRDGGLRRRSGDRRHDLPLGSEKKPKEKDQETTLDGGEVFSSDFHVFGCAITKRAITWYLDGVEQWSFTRANKIAQLVPLYVVCNLAIGGAGGDPDGTPMPVQYVVDYIRAWKAA